MPDFQPEFRRRFAEYLAERDRVRTLDEWRVFRDKWFDLDTWPNRTPRTKRNRHGWCDSYCTKDLDAKDRYEFLSTCARIGLPLEAPHLMRLAKAQRNGFHLSCGFCEISRAAERVPGSTCPGCGRALYLTYVESDDGPADG